MNRARLTVEQKQANKIERKRKALEDHNFKAVGGRGSLFAELAETVTAEQAAWHMRQTRALMIEHLHACPAGHAVFGLEALRLFSIECHARRLIGDEWFAKLNEYARRTFSNIIGYGPGFWCGVLTGDGQTILGFQKFEDPTCKLGFRCEPTEVFPPVGYVLPMTKSEFYTLFPFVKREEVLEPESADPLFDEVMRKLGVTS